VKFVCSINFFGAALAADVSHKEIENGWKN
jgi:hypothetical protein